MVFAFHSDKWSGIPPDLAQRLAAAGLRDEPFCPNINVHDTALVEFGRQSGWSGVQIYLRSRKNGQGNVPELATLKALSGVTAVSAHKDGSRSISVLDLSKLGELLTSLGNQCAVSIARRSIDPSSGLALVKVDSKLIGADRDKQIGRIVITPGTSIRRPQLFKSDHIVYDNVKRFDGSNAVMTRNRVWLIKGRAASFIRDKCENSGSWTSIKAGITFTYMQPDANNATEYELE